MSDVREQRGIARSIGRSVALVIAMFLFATLVMPPLYTLFCDVTGLNGKTRGQATPVAAAVDTSRQVTVRFVSAKNANMPWQFRPEDFSLKVHPGEQIVTHFFAQNPTANIMVGQAVPSMVPHNATDYFHKMACFCFNQQALGPGEAANLGLLFVVDQALPKAINTIILSYTLFDVTASSPQAVAEKNRQLQSVRTADTTHLIAHSP
ncbi:cytochrome c oxidase assembly protein [Teredinibacter turnerae]|uniref:cytochrome c oxidase assembly protein n=1 Tax=Teredinibacter turnerae TaxID=2426 RepID=UPI00041B0987|nr:cytochrome c oxidase assembly protein [Teredinibacter turnerae]